MQEAGEKQYTNTILATSKLDWWKKKALDIFSENFTPEQRELSHGDQVIFRDTAGEKALVFSFSVNHLFFPTYKQTY